MGGRVRPQQSRDFGGTTLTATLGEAPALRRAGQGRRLCPWPRAGGGTRGPSSRPQAPTPFAFLVPEVRLRRPGFGTDASSHEASFRFPRTQRRASPALVVGPAPAPPLGALRQALASGAVRRLAFAGLPAAGGPAALKASGFARPRLPSGGRFCLWALRWQPLASPLGCPAACSAPLPPAERPGGTQAVSLREPCLSLRLLFVEWWGRLVAGAGENQTPPPPAEKSFFRGGGGTQRRRLNAWNLTTVGGITRRGP